MKYMKGGKEYTIFCPKCDSENLRKYAKEPDKTRVSMDDFRVENDVRHGVPSQAVLVCADCGYEVTIEDR